LPGNGNSTVLIDDHRAAHGVSAICNVLQVAPSSYYARLAIRADPTKGSARQRTDAKLRPKIRRVWDDNWQVYAVRKVWRQLCRGGEAVARCTIARLMAGMGLTVNASIHLTANRLRAFVREKVVKTTIPDTSVPCPRDKVNRQFRAPAPNMLWVSDFTYVST
jgi:putative transposase